jgi:hypothetical protein
MNILLQIGICLFCITFSIAEELNETSILPLNETTQVLNTIKTKQVCSLDYCKHDGECYVLDTSLFCKCKDGYRGDRCEISECNASKCSNNGVCLTNLLTNTTKCACNPKYTGALCERPLCIDYCYNLAKCEYLNETSIKCNCQTSRYYGNQCEFDRCETNEIKSCNKSCLLSYNESSQSCDCSCGLDCDRLYCKKNGKCVTENSKLVCKCNQAFSGPQCLVNKCKGFCFNGGICDENTIGCT